MAERTPAALTAWRGSQAGPGSVLTFAAGDHIQSLALLFSLWKALLWHQR